MTTPEYAEVFARLQSLADPAYQAFHSKLVPGETRLMGIRVPALRAFAKELARGDWQGYLSAAGDDWYEEVLLQGMVLGFMKLPIEEHLALLAAFVPKIRNWAICDITCGGLKFVKKHRERVREFLQHYLCAETEYEQRFAVVMLMSYFVDEVYLQDLLSAFSLLRDRPYYVSMAVAWAVSVCYVRFPQETYVWLTQNPLDDETHHRSIRKICESYRVTDAEKARVRTLRRT